MKKEERRELFRALRQETGLSQGKLAELMGLGDRRRINKLETGGGQDRAPAEYHLMHLLAISILQQNNLLGGLWNQLKTLKNPPMLERQNQSSPERSGQGEKQ